MEMQARFSGRLPTGWSAAGAPARSRLLWRDHGQADAGSQSDAELGSGKAEGPGGLTSSPCNSDSPSASEPARRLLGLGAPGGHSLKRRSRRRDRAGEALALAGVGHAKAGGWQ